MDNITEGSIKDDKQPNEKRESLKEAIKEYCHFPYPQGFALMLNGRWGSGKTHFIKSILGDLVPPAKDPHKHKPLYVSLYGIQDLSEVSDQLFQQLHPVLGHKVTRLVGAVLWSAARSTIKLDIGHVAQASGALPDLDLSSMVSGSEGRILVFDDFERAVLSPIVILGYINPLVEHDDCKVLILADEEKVADKDEYQKRKEKTIGRTFEFKCDSDEAFDAFMELIRDEDCRRFMEESKKLILSVFGDSGFDNLRLLKQFLWDFERLWKILTPEQRGHERAMHELASLLCAVSMELRSGGMTPEAFSRDDLPHHLALRAATPNEMAKSVQKVFEKYPTVRFDSMLLEPATIANFILKSELSTDDIQSQLQQHPYFAPLEKMPSWRALWLSAEAPIQEHGEILKRFEADFDNRSFRKEGEINHIPLTIDTQLGIEVLSS
jgi:hypothetical protein